MKRKHAQNSIDYMVFHIPHIARKILVDCGYEPLDDPSDLAKAIKELIKIKGKPIIEELLQHHPDKKAIISVVKPKCSTCQSEIKKNTCTSCSTSNEDSYWDNFRQVAIAEMSMTELEGNYQLALHSAKRQPTNHLHTVKAQAIKTEIDKRKSNNKGFSDKEKMIIAVLVSFSIGFLFGKLT